MSVLFRSRMRVLGISVWIYSIWIFIVGILLFFYTIKPVENFQSTAGSGSRFLTSTLSKPNTWVLNYNPRAGSSQEPWQPINATTDRLLYQQRLPIGGQLYSPNGKYSLLFGTDRIFYLYIVRTSAILWSAPAGANSNYLFHTGDINIINMNSTVVASPFVVTSWGSGESKKNSSYLQLQDNGDLVLYGFDGAVLFNTNTAVPSVFQCIIEQMAYQFAPSDCFNLKAMIDTQRTAIATAATQGKTIEVNAGKQIVCNLEPYYKSLSCDSYLSNTTPLTAAPATPPLVVPTVAISGSVSSGSNTITTNGNLSASVSPGDMIYLGYGNFVGPLVVASTTTNQIILTKRYIGADVTNAVLSIVPMLQGDISIVQDPVKMTTTGTNVIASVYPGGSYIAIDTIDETSSLQNPANIDIGDLVYVKADNCNRGDTDNGDGTCTSYLCQIGELDIGNNQCRRYACNVTNTGTSTAPNITPDTNNGDGTCRTSTSYLDCNLSETYEAGENGGICRGIQSGNNVSYAYTRPRSIKTEPYLYNILDQGSPGTIYTKASGNIQYIYNKTVGPYVVSMAPSANKILIKSFATGDMDSAGNLLYNPTVLWRKNADLWAKYKVNPYYGIEKTTGAVAKTVGGFPGQDNTINLRALPKDGLIGAKLYKGVYNNGQFNGSYASLKPDTSATLRLTANSIIINTTSNNTSIGINGSNLLVGQEYTLTVTVKANNPCTLQVESSTAYPMTRAQWSNETPGYLGGVINVPTIKSFDVAKRLCESTNGCTGITYTPPSLSYTLRNGTITPSTFVETSWARSPVAVTNPSITTSFKAYIWNFVANSSNLSLRVFSSGANTLEINRLDIVGGMTGPLMLLGTTTSPNVKPIAEGITCLSGYYNSSGVCTKCPAGQSSNTGANTCTVCAPGSYSAATGATKCTFCPAGQFSGSQGASGCSSCPVGTFSTGAGNTSVASCLLCPPGSYGPNVGASSCFKCPIGTYSEYTGLSAVSQCKPCPAGTTSAAVGATAASQCSGCPAGTYSLNGNCVGCPPGTYSTALEANSANTCISCPAGQYSTTSGSTGCLYCPAGKFSLSGSTGCSTCPAGSWSAAGYGSCPQCPAGTYSSTIGATSSTTCQGCPAGSYSTRVGATDSSTCISCAVLGVQYYSPSPAAASCLSCGNKGLLIKVPLSSSCVEFPGTVPVDAINNNTACSPDRVTRESGC
jgi:hypothetical protein